MASDKEVTLTVGPLIGMHDGLNLAGQDAQRASYIENMYAPTLAVGGDLISRPGVTRVPLGTATSRTGTISSSAVVVVGTTGYPITGSGTLFLTELAVGDVLVAGGAEVVVTAIATNTALTATGSVAGTFTGSYTYYPAGIKTGPIYGTYRYAHTDGTVRRYLIAATNAAGIGTNAVSGLYRFVGAAAGSNISGYVSSFPNGSATVTGTGTSFTTQLVAGGIIIFSDLGVGQIAGGSFNSGFGFRIKSITSNTVLTVDTNNSGTGGMYETMKTISAKLRLLEYSPSDTTHPFTDRTSATMDNVALYPTARIYGVSFANYLIISDGVNRPRKISSTFVLSNLTDGNYVFKGALVQYYGKLFGIDGSDAITLRWSDENDPDTGYGTGTSDNSWALRQTSADPLECLAATNDALYCFRANSVAIITGAANSDFRSSGSVDAIQNIGCRSPDAIALINGSVVFWDQFGRPGRIAPGYGYIPLWMRVANTIRGAGLTAANLRAAWMRLDPTTNLVKVAYRTATASTTNDVMLTFEPDSWECVGVHKWYSVAATAMDHAYSVIWEDNNNIPRHVVASGTTGDVAMYVQKTETSLSASAKDSLAAGDVTVPVIVETPKLGGDVQKEKTFSRMTVASRNVGGTTAGVTLWKSQIKGPTSTAYTSADLMWLGNLQSVPATMTLDGNAVKAEQKGLNLRGRWLQAKFTNDTTGNPATRATFDTLTLVAAERGSDPGAF